MTNVFDFYYLPEMPFLDDLSEDLESTLLVIAYAGHETNLDFIMERQNQFKKRYGPYMNRLLSDVGTTMIGPAYDGFQSLLDGNPTPIEIARRAQDCLEEYLTMPGYSEEQMEAFEEFYRGTEELD
jgi:hypothetical protein